MSFGSSNSILTLATRELEFLPPAAAPRRSELPRLSSETTSCSSDNPSSPIVIVMRRRIFGLLYEVFGHRRGVRIIDRVRYDLGDLYTENGQTLQGSFSAVSKPNASKYSCESSQRDLHNTLLCTVLRSHFFVFRDC